MNPDATIRPASLTYGSPKRETPPAEPLHRAGQSAAPTVRRIACEVYSRVCGYFRPVKNWNIGKRREFDERLTYSVDVSLASTVPQPAGLFTPDEGETRAPGILGGGDIDTREPAAATVGAYRPDGDVRLSA